MSRRSIRLSYTIGARFTTAARELGDKGECLIDLGHHAPNVNIEKIVARLIVW